MTNIVLYSTNCPKCHILEKKLDDKRIKFSCVLDSDVMISKGFMSAPVLEVDNKYLEFSDAIKWVNEQ